MASEEHFRLRPRRAWAVWLMVAFGALLALLPALYRVGGAAGLLDVVAGLGVCAACGLYLASPTWRSYVSVDERGLAVISPRKEKLRLSWDEVREVIADEEEQAALVRGPEGGRSFLLPSGGHPAPYQVERAGELYRRILAHVPAERVRRSKVFQ
jgi:hypothetical protein